MMAFVRTTGGPSHAPGSLREAAAPRPAETLRISVVIPSSRRPELLWRCLSAVFAQSIGCRAFEVIVVDDGRSAETQAVVEAFRHRPDGPTLRLLRPRHGGGPAVARNVGWRAAYGHIVAFTSDDAVPAPDWLERGADALGPELVAVFGRIDPTSPGQPGATDREPASSRAGVGFVSANVFVRRSALLAVGGFDERFHRAGREDSDLQFRLLRDAGPVGRSSHAVVQRGPRPQRWTGLLRQQKDGFFDALLYKKHPALYREHLGATPPWSHYAIVGLTLVAALLWMAEIHGSAVVGLALAGAGVLRLAVQRSRQRSGRGRLVEAVVTSALIPYLSVYWRVRGAIHFRVLFL